MTFDDLVAQAEAKYRAGDTRGAYDAVLRVFEQTKAHGRAHYVMALLAGRSGDAANARKLAARALEIDGDTPEYLAALAQCHMLARDRVGARAAALKAAAFADATADVLAVLSGVLHALALYDEGLTVLERLAARDPGNAVVLANLGSLQVVCGRKEQALATLAEATRLDPGNMDAYANIAAARRARTDDNNVAALQALLESSDDRYRRIKLGHALAREYDDLERHEESFAALTAAKALYPSDGGYDFGLFPAIDDAMARLEDVPASSCTADPLFITGVPRSGTTLVERIVTNGTGVVSLGESAQMLDLFDPNAIDRWHTLDFQRAGDTYAGYARAFAPGAARTVDKFPLNLLLAPAILKALPEAKILCVLRDPMDTVIGNFRLLFSLDAALYRYSRTIEDTARFVAEAHALAHRLHRAYPGHVHLVDYEALVADPLREGRALIDFCGIGWRDDLVAIERNTTPAGSASAGQVRTAIHGDYQGRWRGYERHLAPAKAIFEARQIRWR